MEIDGWLATRLRAAEQVVAFTGAGVSQESGVGTFRGADGLWERFRPEELAHPRAFALHPARVWSWYAPRFGRLAEAEPNAVHRALARWPGFFPVFTLVTQNVDGLHQRAGSPEVVELHGSLREARCHACASRRPMEEAVLESPSEPPRCACGGRYRPDVVRQRKAWRPLPRRASRSTSWLSTRMATLVSSR
jgi:NAD-dependent deacetylase